MFCSAMMKPIHDIFGSQIKIMLITRHSLYIRTVSSYHMLSALLNWFKLVYELFGQSNMHRTLEFCPEQPVRNQMTTTQIQISHQN